MKTISLLGMIFLPGTFIAVSSPSLFPGIHQELLQAIFSMPFLI
jgi:hypothetical protein